MKVLLASAVVHGCADQGENGGLLQMRSVDQSRNLSIVSSEHEPEHCQLVNIPGTAEYLCDLPDFATNCSHTCWDTFNASGACLDNAAASDFCAVIDENTHEKICTWGQFGDLCCATCERFAHVKPACVDRAEENFGTNFCNVVNGTNHAIFCTNGMIRDNCCATCSHHNTTSTTTTTTTTTTPRCSFQQGHGGAGYLKGCARGKAAPCDGYTNASLAFAECVAEPTCGGITLNTGTGIFELRAGLSIRPSPGDKERSAVCVPSDAEVPPTHWFRRCDYHEVEDSYLNGCAKGMQNKECVGSQDTLDAALVHCDADPNCGGVTSGAAGVFELRKGNKGVKASKFAETSWVCGPRKFTAVFEETCEEAGGALITDHAMCAESMDYLGVTVWQEGFELKNETLPAEIGLGCRGILNADQSMLFNFHYEPGHANYTCSHNAGCVCNMQ